MDIFNNLLFWIHLACLALGGAATFGLPVVGMQIPGATAETRPTLFKVAKGLSTVGRAGLGGLIVTGALLVWLKFGGTAGFTWWFWLKLALVVLLIINIVVAGTNAARAAGGDMVAGSRAPMFGMISMALLLLIILSAVFAFN